MYTPTPCHTHTHTHPGEPLDQVPREAPHPAEPRDDHDDTHREEPQGPLMV